MGCSRTARGFASLVVGLLLCSLVTSAHVAGEQPFCMVSVSGPGPNSPIKSFSWSCFDVSGVTVGVDKSLAAQTPQPEGITFNNTCSKPGCLITVCGSTPLALRFSSFKGLNVPKVDSVLCVANSSQVSISNSTFSNNRARAIQARDNANVTVYDSNILESGLPRANGGGVWLGAGSPTLTMLNSTVSSNTASNGGGLWVGGSATAVINGSSISGNHGNTLRGTSSGLGGGVAVMDNATLVLGGNTTVDSNTAGTSGAGVYTAGTAALIVSPDVRFGLNQVVNKSFGFDVAASGASRLDLPPVTFNNYSNSDLAGISKCSKGVALERNPCGVGEFKDNRTGVCMCCPERTYSFDASGTCLACPKRGACPGGDALEPMAGFWRSSNKSTQMVLCPLGSVACAGGPGEGKCQPGYTGRLCGTCDKGFGTIGPLRCGKCVSSPRLQFAIYLIMSIFTAIFVAITVHLTYADNVEGSKELRSSDVIRILILYVQHHAIIYCVHLPWPQFMANLLRASEAVFGIGAGSALCLQCWAPAIAGKPKDKLPNAMRIQLVTLMTPAMVFAAVVLLRLLWWCLMKCLSAAARKSSSGCVTSRFIKAVTPSTLRALARKLPLTMLVTLFFGFPTLLRTSLRFFACLPIDSPSRDSTVPLLSHKQGYLMVDLSQECWVGWHKAWALGLGIPTVLFCYVMIPIAMLWVLKANQHRADELTFRETFGFFYRNYKPEKMWWESVWCLETVILSAVAVQHFALGAYQAILFMALIFFAFVCVQAIFKPYAIQKLHQVHYGATTVLFLTCLAALAMFHVEGVAPIGKTGRTAISALVMILHLGFVFWCLYEAAAASGKSVKAMAGKVVGCVTCQQPKQGPGIEERYPSSRASSVGIGPALSLVDSALQLNQPQRKGSVRAA